MSKTIAAAAALLLAGGAVLCLAQQPQPEREPTNRPFMLLKLKYGQEVLRGLSLADYESIASNAQRLLLMSNESNWNVFQTPEYNRLSREFQDAADRLRKAGKEKNLDGATLAYFEVTLNCVRCHKYTRDQ
jgi:hypothetical protein